MVGTLTHPDTARPIGARQLTVIANERAGVDAQGWQAELGDALRQAGLLARVERVEGGRIAAEAARAAARGDILIAAGGDGTVSAVASVAVEAGATFGVLPSGTLNHFARDAGIPIDRGKAIEVIAAGFVRQIDVAEVNGHVFVNNVSLGLYPRVVWVRQSEQDGGRRKWPAFAIGVFRTWQQYRTLTVRLSIDGRDFVRRTPFVFIGNGEYQVEGLQMGLRPSLREGALSLYVAPECGRFEILALALRALARRITPEVKLESFLAQAITIEPASRRVSVAIDGELLVLEPPLRCRIRPAALRTIVPRPE